ncbi:MAG: ABC transporter ATP-binding protein [Planctomycetota bacterium]
MARKARLPVRRLIALARPEWRLIVAATAFLFVGSAAGLVYPQAFRMLIDTVSESGLRHVDRTMWFMVGVVAVQSVSIGLRIYLFSVAGERIVTRLRERLYGHVLSQEVAFFDERRTGELMSRLASDTTVLQTTVTVNVSMALRNVLLGVGGIVLMIFTSPPLTLLMLWVVPPIVIGALWMGRFIERLSKESQDALAVSGNVAEETLAGIRTVRAFTGEQRERRRYGDSIWKSFALARRRSRGVAWFVGISYFTSFAALALVLRAGLAETVTGGLTGGELTQFILYGVTAAFALGGIGEVWAELMRARGSSERVFALLDREPALPLSGGATPNAVTGRLELREVSFSYPSRPDVPALCEVSLVLAPGEVVALVGPSGAGKSTVAALVPRLYDPDRGALLLDGADIRTLDPQWLRARIGGVAQEPLLFGASIAANIRYGRPDASEAEVQAAARAAHAHEFIVALPEGYATEVGERGVQLSGGQRQRVAIARAVLKDPAILILDEATSALDAESEALVKDALAHLMRGRTSLVIAHRLSTVRDAHRVVVLDGGRVVQTGRHADLMADPDGLYARLVARQFVGG